MHSHPIFVLEDLLSNLDLIVVAIPVHKALNTGLDRRVGVVIYRACQCVDIGKCIGHVARLHWQ